MQTLAHNESKHIFIDGGKIVFKEAGNVDGKTILLLHGGFGTLEDFESILEPLLQDFRIIAMDTRGQGQSTLGNAQLTYERLQYDAEHLLAELEITEVFIVGFSDGGMTAHRMAISNNIKVLKVVSIAAPWRKKDLHESAELLKNVTPASWREKFPGSYHLYKQLNTDIDFIQLVESLKFMWLDEGDTGGYPEHEISAISCPVLVIRGDDDHLFSAESAYQLVSELKNSTLLNIPFAGHEVHKDQADMVKHIIFRFLKSQEMIRDKPARKQKLN